MHRISIFLDMPAPL